MSEIDDLLMLRLREAELRANAAGRHDLADYLRLKASNDAIRTAAVEWLFDTLLELASRATHGLVGLTVEREEPHIFKRGASTMAGALIEIRQGVRCLTLEAGWARAPEHGIMQNGALAYGRISHFGRPKLGGEIRLVRGNDTPVWLGPADGTFDSAAIQKQIDLLLEN